MLAILLVAGVTYAAVNLNLTSGQAITQDVWSEVVTKLNKIDNLETEITVLKTKNTELETANTNLQGQISSMQGEIDTLEVASGDKVSLLDSKNIGTSWTNWTISGVTPYKPVILSVKGTTTGYSQFKYYVTSGTTNAKSSGSYYYEIGMSTGRYMSSSDILIPDDTGTITIKIIAGSNYGTIYAYQ